MLFYVTNVHYRKNEIKNKDELERLEQCGCSENVEIRGVPITPNESTNQIVKIVADLLKVQLDEKQISMSHRLKTLSNNHVDPSKQKKKCILPL